MPRPSAPCSPSRLRRDPGQRKAQPAASSCSTSSGHAPSPARPPPSSRKGPGWSSPPASGRCNRREAGRSGPSATACRIAADGYVKHRVLTADEQAARPPSRPATGRARCACPTPTTPGRTDDLHRQPPVACRAHRIPDHVLARYPAATAQPAPHTTDELLRLLSMLHDVGVGRSPSAAAAKRRQSPRPTRSPTPAPTPLGLGPMPAA